MVSRVDDLVEGREGDDTLFGGYGGDLFYDATGADRINFARDDTAYGGSGADLFLYGGDLSTGAQVIADFDGISLNAANGEDRIAFRTGLEVGSFTYIEAAVFTGGGNSEARYAGGGTLEVD